MRLLFAIKRLENASGGSERVLAKVCSDLADRGHDVQVLTWDRRGAEPFYSFAPGVRILNRGVGDTAHPTRPWEFLRRLADLRQAVSTARPDVVVGFGHSMFVPMAFALVGMSTPRIGSEHAAMAHYRTRPAQYLLLRLSARLLRAITVISEALAIDYPPDVRAKFVVLPNPALAKLQPQRPANAGRRRTVLNVGRLDPQKDQATLVRAFARVAPEFPEWRLTIRGEGPLRPQLEALIRELGLEAKIALPGVTPAIDAEYATADMFALSSAYESYGLVSIEAMSHGLPVLGFADCPGTNEVVLDGLTGLLVGNDPDRVSSYAAGLCRLMSDADLRRRLGAAGRDRIAHMAANCDVVDRWEDLLTCIAAKGDLPYAN